MVIPETAFNLDKIKNDSYALIEKVGKISSVGDVAGMEKELLMCFSNAEMAKEYLYDYLIQDAIDLNYFRLISNALFLSGNIVNQAKKEDPDLMMISKCKDEISILLDRVKKYKVFAERERQNVSNK